ncbi:MAG: hypothetical protein IPL61_27350 [Myxococcales bacterium]|nr:hypothetical protein [Myxococcales bacterium]
MRTPPALVLTLALSSVVTGCGRHNGAVVMGIGIATIVAAPIVGSAASEPPPDRSDGAPDGLHLDLGPAVVGAPSRSPAC